MGTEEQVQAERTGFGVRQNPYPFVKHTRGIDDRAPTWQPARDRPAAAAVAAQACEAGRPPKIKSKAMALTRLDIKPVSAGG